MTTSNITTFEKEADNLAKTLTMLDQPIEDLLHQLFWIVETLFQAGKLREGFDLLSRLSYLPSVLPEAVSKNSGITEERLIYEGQNLISYLHFCELMPQVYSNYLEVIEKEDGFQLRHKDSSSSLYEIKDVLMADLSRPFLTYSPSFSLEETARILNSTSSTKFPTELAQSKIDQKLEKYWDIFEISDTAFHGSLGITVEELNQFRAFMLAYADFLQAVIELNKHNYVAQNFSEKARFNYFKSVYPFFPDESLIEEIEQCTGLTRQKVSTLMRFFTLAYDLSGSTNPHCRDGYLPPILKSQKGHHFYPVAVKTFISNRNLLLALQAFDQRSFDSMISGAFEPSLIEAIKAELTDIENLEIRTNRSWCVNSSSGEIDILVYHTKLKKALVIEVKAFMPPQGARMVKNVSSRVKEGIRQILKFRHLSTQDREDIISGSLGFQASGIEITEVILVSSCIGSSEVWSELEGENICGTNFLLFKILVAEVIQTGEPDLLFNMEVWTERKLTDLITDSQLEWEEKEIELIEKKISFPSWSIDEQPLREIRKEVFQIQS